MYGLALKVYGQLDSLPSWIFWNPAVSGQNYSRRGKEQKVHSPMERLAMTFGQMTLLASDARANNVAWPLALRSRAIDLECLGEEIGT